MLDRLSVDQNWRESLTQSNANKINDIEMMSSWENSSFRQFLTLPLPVITPP